MSDRSTEPPVLIAGAGPTGLVLALSLSRRGIPVRIVDAKDGPADQSRAMGVHARTLEFYRQFGFADEMVDAGIVAETVHLRRRDRDGTAQEKAAVSLKALGEGLSPYPFMLTYPQDDHERFLVGKLKALGVDVEWRTRLVTFAQDDAGVDAVLAVDGREETMRTPYLAGCDGAHSVVRHTLGIDFPGGAYDQLFFVADVSIDRGFDADIHVNLGAHSLLLMMPVRSRGVQRLIGLVPDDLAGREGLSFDDVREGAERLAGVKVTAVNWFSTYRVHHRVADRFRVGRAFVAGDAGHVHSPSGGQGMNTGIGDAVNLAWKLADVLRGRAGERLLDSYGAERIPFARKLVETTDRVFERLVADGIGGEVVRDWLAPTVVATATRFAATRHLAFRTLSQTAIGYPDSPLSDGSAGVDGGDRLPWVPGDAPDDDNFAPLRSLDWQVHVYGEAEAELADACERAGLPLHVLRWNDAAHRAGLRRDATYVVRPDGHVALAVAHGAAAALDDYLDRIGLRLVERPTAIA